MDVLAPAITPSSPQEKEWVFEQLIAFNRQAMGMTPEAYSQPLNFHLRTPDDRIIAGINATIMAGGSVYVAILWVDAAYRGKNYGAQLLQHVENEARKRGIGMIHLETLEFQAKDFYQKQGYTLYGTLEDSPTVGQTRYYFSKRVSAT